MHITFRFWQLALALGASLGMTSLTGDRASSLSHPVFSDWGNRIGTTFSGNLARGTNPSGIFEGRPSHEPILLSAASVYQDVNQTNPGDSLAAVPLDKDGATDFLDIRGVGDAGMALTHKQPLKLTDRLVDEGSVADYSVLLNRFDPTGKSYRGDLSFINWETVVGTQCQQFWAARSPQRFAFVSHPDNLARAFASGFNLIGLANNHTRDCLRGENGMDGTVMSEKYVQLLEQQAAENGQPFLWGGVGRQKTARIQTFDVKGRSVKVAFASLYMGGGGCPTMTCADDANRVLQSLRDSQADVRILAIHSWNAATQNQLVDTGIRFLREYNGDIVFGHGPHTKKPVRIVQSKSGKRGVLFESLGDFLHPNLAGGADNLIGRVLFDRDTLTLRQVQVIPLWTNGALASFKGAESPTSIPANVTWKAVNDATWRSGVSETARGAYANVKR